MLGGGGAIASADTDTGGSTTKTEHKSGANPVRRVENLPGTQTVGRLNEVIQKTLHDVTSVFGSGRVPGQPTTVGGNTAKPDTAIPSATNENDSDPVTPVQDGVTNVPGVTTPVADTVTSNSPASGPAPDSTEPVVDTDPPVTTAPVVTATTIPWVIEPVVTVITTIQYVVTAAVYTVAYTVAPIASDLTSLLGAATVLPPMNPLADSAAIPSTGTGGGPVYAPLPAAVDVPGLPFPAAAGVAGLSTVSPAGIAAPGVFDRPGSTPKSALTGEVPLAETSVFPASLKRFFEHAVSAVLRSPSLSALAALALPGLLGLFVIGGAGIRFGYRQAKAALALPTSKLARFAAPAPLRLVRSRSAAALNRPASRFIPREISGRLENAA